MKFFSISSLRDDIAKYLKKDSYTNCKSDLCNFFKGKSNQQIFDSPILLAPSKTCRYIKSRIESSNNNIGKSGGYRLYYYVDVEADCVFLLGYYPKIGKYKREDLSKAEETQMIQIFKDERKLGQLVEHNIQKNFREIKLGELLNAENEAQEEGNANGETNGGL